MTKFQLFPFGQTLFIAIMVYCCARHCQDINVRCYRAHTFPSFKIAICVNNVGQNMYAKKHRLSVCFVCVCVCFRARALNRNSIFVFFHLELNANESYIINCIISKLYDSITHFNFLLF